MRRLLACLAIFICAASAVAQEPLERIVFGSCNSQEKSQKFWDPIVALKPNLFLMCGDNIYADTQDMAEMKRIYGKLLAEPGFQKVKAMCPILATWDDHDYGKNDAGQEYPKREESQQILLDTFDYPKDSPLRTQKGVYHSKIFGPADKSVQVLMLDTRYHRSTLTKRGKFIPNLGPYIPTTDKTTTVLGEEQWKWLEGELKKPAKIRLFVSSIQVVSEDHGWEKWMNTPHERDRLFKLLKDTGAEGVIVLSGDRHHAELSVMDAGLGYPLYDLTASGFNFGNQKWRLPELNKHRVAVQFWNNNFGAILIDWSKEDPLLRLQIRNDDGEIAINDLVPLSVLKAGSLKTRASTASAPLLVNGIPFTSKLGKELLGKSVNLTMTVAATGQSKKGDLVFLNSTADRMADDNFTIVLNKGVQDGLKALGIANPKSTYEGKAIRVLGVISEFNNRPQIVVADASKITLEK